MKSTRLTIYDEISNRFTEVMPNLFYGDEVVKDLIYRYAFNPSELWWYIGWLDRAFTYFGRASLQLQMLVYYASHLDIIEAYIRTFPRYLTEKYYLDGFEYSLIEIAVINLDFTLENDVGFEFSKGAVEKILDLHAELYPETFPQAVRQAALAAPAENKEEKELRQQNNIYAINKIFNAVKLDNEKVELEIKNFIAYVRKAQPKEVRNNVYHMNLLHLLYVAFDVFLIRIDELNLEQKKRFWLDAIAKAICWYAIPPRVRALIWHGLHNMFGMYRKYIRKFSIYENAPYGYSWHSDWDRVNQTMQAWDFDNNWEYNAHPLLRFTEINNLMKNINSVELVERYTLNPLFTLISKLENKNIQLQNRAKNLVESKPSILTTKTSSHAATFFSPINSKTRALEMPFWNKCGVKFLEFLKTEKWSKEESAVIKKDYYPRFVQHLCELVLQDKTKELVQLLNLEPNLMFEELKESEFVKDHVGRLIHGSPYRIAWGTGSVKVLNEMDKIIDNIPGGREIAFKQYQKQFHKSISEHKSEYKDTIESKSFEKKINFSQLLDVITSEKFLDDKISEITEKELLKFREFFKINNQVIKSGKHFDFELLIAANNLCRQHDESYADDSELRTKQVFLIASRVLGYIQSQLPACDLLALYKGTYYIVKYGEDVNDKDLSSEFESCTRYINDFISQSKTPILGDNCYICTSGIVRDCESNFNFKSEILIQYLKNKNENLEKLALSITASKNKYETPRI